MNEHHNLEIDVTSRNIHLKYSYSKYALCCGDIEVHIIPLKKTFTDIFLSSGGQIVSEDNEWCSMYAETGPWDVILPDDFPGEYSEELKELINTEIPWGCCGGCI